MSSANGFVLVGYKNNSNKNDNDNVVYSELVQA